MKKYFLVFKNSLQSSMAYRFNTFSYFISELLSFLVMFYLWSSIYRQGGQIGEYDLKALIFYYLFVNFITLVIWSQDTARIVGDAIREGTILNFLTKPINFLYKELFSGLGVASFRFIIYALLFFPLVLFFDYTLLFAGAKLIFFFFSLIIAFLIRFLTFYLVGASTFYFGFIQGFNFVMISIVSFISGGIIPLDLLPAFLLNIINFLPFKFISFVPIMIITGRIELINIWRIFLSGLFWVIIMYFLAIIIYGRGLKKYEAFSG